MDEKTKHQTLALAGILQAAALINELATHGHCNEYAFATCIRSIYILDPDDLKSIYGEKIEGLAMGLSTLYKLLTQEKNMLKKMTVRYFFSLLHLERKFIKNKDCTTKLRERLKKITDQADFCEDPFTSDKVADLADAYLDTLSTLSFKIILRGARHHLSERHNLNRIRALLLAGIRSTVLWRQLGGNRWQFLFGREKILKSVRELLK